MDKSGIFEFGGGLVGLVIFVAVGTWVVLTLLIPFTLATMRRDLRACRRCLEEMAAKMDGPETGEEDDKP